jgi:hypothetical protein
MKPSDVVNGKRVGATLQYVEVQPETAVHDPRHEHGGRLLPVRHHGQPPEAPALETGAVYYGADGFTVRLRCQPGQWFYVKMEDGELVVRARARPAGDPEGEGRR